MNLTNTHILFVDDDPKAGSLITRYFENSEFTVRAFPQPRAALDYFSDHGADIIVTDFRMPGLSGLDLLKEIRHLDAEVPVILITAHASVESAIDALRAGANDFIRKPFDLDELRSRITHNLAHSKLRRENRLLKRQLQSERLRYGMLGNSVAMESVYRVIDKIADIRCSVIIQGESGTGKELAARAVHQAGEDPQRPFVVIDCGALTENLLESELFGHEKGAFTGADQAKPGLFEAASGGTVFLDEIGNISAAMQTRLLRAIEEQRITRVGGLREVGIDVRFIAATNSNLQEMVTQGGFRADLYHRLNVVTINMPPLRQRAEDIPLLTRQFIDRFNEQYRRNVQDFDAVSRQRLSKYPWPGNVRELRNVVDRQVALADGPIIEFEEVPGHSTDRGDPGIDADNPSLGELERRYIEKLLRLYDGNRTKVAETMNINKSTLWRRLRGSEHEPP